MVKNNLLQFRMKLGYKTAKQFAIDAEVNYVSYIQWENNTTQISLENLIKVYNFIKPKLPNTNLQDLLIIEDEN